MIALQCTGVNKFKLSCIIDNICHDQSLNNVVISCEGAAMCLWICFTECFPNCYCCFNIYIHLLFKFCVSVSWYISPGGSDNSEIDLGLEVASKRLNDGDSLGPSFHSCWTLVSRSLSQSGAQAHIECTWWQLCWRSSTFASWPHSLSLFPSRETGRGAMHLDFSFVISCGFCQCVTLPEDREVGGGREG